VRAESWDNYCQLFDVVLSSNLNIQLPNSWLWDMVDEFIYQFQSAGQYRGMLDGRAAEDAEALRLTRVWDSASVLGYLDRLVTRSGIREELSTPAGAQALFDTEGYVASRSNVLRMLGYFSLIGLLRVHSVLGDFEAGMRAMAPLNPHDRRALFATKIALATITMFYYSSFAYMVLGRYLDSAKCLGFVLAYIAKVKHHHQGAAQLEVVKKQDQM
jgi:translation initiation factor 3 subunit L